jgi:hypothetical protein
MSSEPAAEPRGKTFAMATAGTVAVAVFLIALGLWWSRPRERIVEVPTPVGPTLPIRVPDAPVRPVSTPAPAKRAAPPPVEEAAKPWPTPRPKAQSTLATPRAVASRWTGKWQREGQLYPNFRLSQSGAQLSGTYTPNDGRSLTVQEGRLTGDDEALFAIEDQNQWRYHLRMKLLPDGDATVEMWITPEDAVRMVRQVLENKSGSPLERNLRLLAARQEAALFERHQPAGIFQRTLLP